MSYNEESEFRRPYSEETAGMIDGQVRKIIELAMQRTTSLLQERKTEIDKLATVLLEKEVLNRSDLIEILGDRPFGIRHAYDDLKPQKK